MRKSQLERELDGRKIQYGGRRTHTVRFDRKIILVVFIRIISFSKRLYLISFITNTVKMTKKLEVENFPP